MRRAFPKMVCCSHTEFGKRVEQHPQQNSLQQPPRQQSGGFLRYAQKALTVACLSAAILIGFRFHSDIEKSKLVKENAQISLDVASLGSQVALLRAEVDSLHRLDRKLRNLAALDPISDDVRRMAVGGAVYEPENTTLGSVSSESIDQLLREASLLRESFLESAERLAMRADELDRMPSIPPVNNGFISSRYGYRNDPFTGRRRMHKGMDFQAAKGTPVYAPAGGRVIQSGRVPGFGRVIKLDHGNGIVTVYGHLSKIRVRNGQEVERGERIGDVGSSGRSTSSHLHYEVRVNGQHKDPSDYIFDELAEIN